MFGAVTLTAAFLFADNALNSPYPWLNHDVSFLSYAGSELLKGSRLYVEFQEMNPPGAHFLQEGILGVAATLGVSEFLLTHLFVLALGIAGILMLRWVYRDGGESQRFIFVTLAYALVVVRGNFSNNVVPSAPAIPYDFGQRDHLFTLLFLPYLLWRISSRRASIFVYPYLVLLGYVAVWKPYWPLLLVAVELYLAIRRRQGSFRAWAALAVGMMLPYGILLLHSHESFQAFFGDVVPLILGGAYSHYGMAFSEFMVSPLHLQMLMGGLILVLIWWICIRQRFLDRPSLFLILAVTGGSYLIYTVQQKFWSYQGMLFFGTVVVLGSFLLATALKRLTRGDAQFWIVSVLAIMFLIVLGSGLRNLKLMLDHFPPKGQELVPLLEDYDKVMFFSTGSDYSYAPVRLRIETVGPWREHFRLPALLAIEDPERRARALDDYAREVSMRIERTRPDLLLFAPLGLGLPPGRHIHDVFREHGAIPDGSYRRIPDDTLSSQDLRLVGWIVYRRFQ